ncbi:uncharacterized protein A4U43_C05F11670 [Asparagus officinalis]|uniref:DC-UbP/UBTD2 N-terminal domain-containing protein n=1 Tax=Asparagus officinalis TaxID=4686 RepID=A0A5P1EVC9_ASPOF|nr:uncharacterized protein A4U43_C05F11670 [Asparagus officinalis]
MLLLLEFCFVFVNFGIGSKKTYILFPLNVSVSQMTVFFCLFVMNKYHSIHFVSLTEIWDALRAAVEADLNLAQAIVDSAGVIIASADMTTCYDERGAKYELPKYVLSEPTNLIRDN